MRHVRVRRIVAGAAAAAAATIVLAAPPASAGSETCTTRYDGDFCAGTVRFEPLGEHLIVKDWLKDGHGVRGYLQWYSNWEWHWVTPSTGVYNGRGYLKERDFNYSITDGHSVRYKVCLSDGSGPGYACSSWTNDFA